MLEIFLKIGILDMVLDTISYDLLKNENSTIKKEIQSILQHKGIIGVRDVPNFENLSREYIETARLFSKLEEIVKQRYAPNRDAGETEGYELGAEWFLNQDGQWKIDNKKASYYAFVPDHPLNKWPSEIDLKTSYLNLGELIFQTGKMLLNLLGLNESNRLLHEQLVGYGRMLHYHKDNNDSNDNETWCGAHTDHGVFTGLIPAYYFQDEHEVDEPKESGLYIAPSNGAEFEKIDTSDKSTLLFQVGEFGQLILNDRIKATQHKVAKSKHGIERYTFALFYSADDDMIIKSKSLLNQDLRYIKNQMPDGSISYKNWAEASYERYRADKINDSNIDDR
jgi:isopenicillin N synthase-like dioxygenase